MACLASFRQPVHMNLAQTQESLMNYFSVFEKNYHANLWMCQSFTFGCRTKQDQFDAIVK